MEKYNKVKEILENYNQTHILKILDRLDGEKKEELLDQVLSINFDELKQLCKKPEKKIIINFEDIEPVTAINKEKLQENELSNYIKKGEEIIKNNKFAVATMAGGQGTRLGHHGPKGTFKVNVGENGKYLFEIIIDNLKRANKKYNVIIPWYIMTSKENHMETLGFLEEKKYFGYPKDEITLFKQDEFPFVDKSGKLLIGENFLIKEAAEGNGGIFSSMKKNGILDDMKRKGIEWVFIGSVDNILLQLVDTTLIGVAISENTKIATKTIIKANPYEKVGVLCRQGGRTKVIEYTEIPKETAEKINEQGELVFGESHIMCNLFNIEALEKAGSRELQYHVAFKKADYIDENGTLVRAEEENSYKFEKFIFDAFILFDKISILRGRREEDFAPIKNQKGIDSPKTAKKLYESYWKDRK